MVKDLRPNALRLADRMEQIPENKQLWFFKQVAIELRMLQQQNERLGKEIREESVRLEKAENQRDDLLNALLSALPFVEDAADDEVYKSHRVHEILGKIKAAIAKTMGVAA